MSSSVDHIIGKIYCGERPHRPKPRLAFQKLEPQHVLDLTSEFPPLEYPTPLLSYTKIPIVEFESPTLQEFEQIVQVFDKIQPMSNSHFVGESIYVHCHFGRGRAPTAIMAYFLTQGMDLLQATQLLKAKRTGFSPNAKQILGLKRFFDALS